MKWWHVVIICFGVGALLAAYVIFAVWLPHS